MTQLAEPLPFSLETYYPQFLEVGIPEGIPAVRAWRGWIRPFSSNQEAIRILRSFEADRPVTVDRGTLAASGNTHVLPPHWCERLLVSMGTAFEVLLLDREEPRHPTIYCVSPRICRRTFPCHPHSREDIAIVQGRGPLPALCVYSAAEHRFADDQPRIVQFLDQAATYLAKHLIWTKTRRLYTFPDGAEIRMPLPGELIVDCESRIKTHPVMQLVPTTRREWRGFWPGLTAPTGIERHLETIRPTTQCWCGSGSPYEECHRPRELAWFNRPR